MFPDSLNPLEGKTVQPKLVDVTYRPTVLEDWNLQDPIARENWASFLIRSFAFSQGSQFRQFAFMRWVEINQGYNLQSAVQQSRLPNFFTDEEIQSFANAMRQVRTLGHRNTHQSDHNDLRLNISDEIIELYSRFKTYAKTYTIPNSGYEADQFQSHQLEQIPTSSLVGISLAELQAKLSEIRGRKIHPTMYKAQVVYRKQTESM